MRRAAAAASAALALLLLAACAAPREGGPRDRPRPPNPSAVIAAELAFNRLAQDKGMAAAFRETAHRDAVMFVPQRVRALDWLRSGSPGAGVSWSPHAVFASCDGAAAATTGAWRGTDGGHGYFTTVWLRSADGGWKWVLDHGAALTGAPRAAPEFIEAKEARCGSPPPVAGDSSAGSGESRAGSGAGDDVAVGRSADRTLDWRSQVRPDGSRRVTVRLWDGAAMRTVIDDEAPATAARGRP